MRGLRALTVGMLVAAGAIAVAALVYVLWFRVAYPYDLEWMEGGELCHALRIARHLPLYGPPTVDFIPYLYTPIYPALLAALAHLVPIGYLVGRIVSLVGMALAVGSVAYFVARETGSRAMAFATVALVAAAYVPTGAWYELARPDSLYLGFCMPALIIGWYGRHSHSRVILSALLMVAAFLTKQTAAPLMVSLGVVLLLSNWKCALSYAAALALFGLPALYYLDSSTGSWFWTYVFELHQKHAFYMRRAWVTTPMVLALIVGPGLVLIPWAALVATAGRQREALGFACFVGAVGAGVACVGFGTQWAHINAFVPGVLGLALAVGTAAGIVLPRAGGWLAPLLFGGSIALAPGGGERLGWRYVPLLGTTPPETGYELKHLLPTERDRTLNAGLVERLRQAPGEVLIPFHPFYAELAGKQPYLHRMGVMDVERAGLAAPIGLAEALATRRFALAVFDNKIEGNWFMWPGLLEHYQITERIAGARMRAGADTSPAFVLTPKAAPPVDATDHSP